MGKDLVAVSERARGLFELADEVSGRELSAVIFEGDESALAATDTSQIAILVVSLAARAVLEERGISSDACAGFSLGEYAAFVDTGVLDERSALELVGERGRIMEQVSRSLDDEGERAGMAAVIGLSPESVATALSAELSGRAFAANLNSPLQTVISGTAEGLLAAGELLKGMGARRVVPLKVSGPFHSPLMSEAREQFSAVLARVRFADPVKPVYSNVTGTVVSRGEKIRELCARQLTEPVRWIDEERAIANDRYDRLVEVGPGTVLSGLWRSFTKSESVLSGSGEPVECFAAGTAEQIDALGNA